VLRHLARWWVVVILLGGATGEWLRRPGWGWGVAIALLGLALPATLRPLAGWRRRALAAASLVLVAAVAIAQWRLHRIVEQWPAEREARVAAAGDVLARDLHDAFQRADRLAARAAEIGRRGDREEAFRRLAGAVPAEGPETGVAILGPRGEPWAWAGRHRLPPVLDSDSIAARTTGYYVVLETRRHSGRERIAIASVLVWAHPAALAANRSLAALFERRTDVGLAVYPAGAAPDSVDVFDYVEQTTAGPDTLYSVQPLPPGQGTAKERAETRGQRAVAWLLMLLLPLALALTSRPLERIGFLPLVVWLAMRAPLGEALGRPALFSPAVFHRGLLGPFSSSAGVLAVAGAALALAAIALRRRGGEPRRWHALPAIVLLVAAPFLVDELGRGITPPAGGVPIWLWLVWQLALFVAGAALVVAAAALLRGAPGGRAGARVAVGVGIAVAATLAGMERWDPLPGWPAWFPLVWTPALLLVALPARRRLAIAGIAVAIGSLAALVTWRAELVGRIQTAQRDVAGLGAEADPLALPLLEELGDRLEGRTLPADAAGLYALWHGSALGAQGYPASLAIWRADGARLVDLALDSLDLPPLAPLVARAAADTTSRLFTLERLPGVHHLLLVPAADGRVLAVAVGPRTALVPRSRLGRLLEPERKGPAYRLTLSTPVDGVRRIGAMRWHREDRQLRGERAVVFEDGLRIVYASIDLRGPVPVLVRGALVLIVDVLALALLWVVAEAAAGRRTRVPSWGGVPRSFRIRLAVTLAAFFIVPVVVFALWGFARLRDEAERSRDLLIQQSLRDASAAAGGVLSDADTTLQPALEALGARLDADLALYRGGRLAATSARILADLGVVTPLLDPVAYHALALDGDPELTRDGPNREPADRIGYRVIDPGPGGAAAVLAAPQLADRSDLSLTQLDLGLVLLLATLLGAGAALVGAQVAARALSRPVAELRRSALALGQGRPMPVPEHAPPLEFEPVFGAFQRMAADIAASRAALEEARRRTATVLATVATGVIALDADGRVLIANRRAVDLLGRELPEGASLLGLLSGEWAPLADAVRSDLARQTDAGSDGAAVELTVGHERLTAQLASLGRDPRGIVVALNDVTDVSRAERVLAWGEMARQVAHEIKNPLTPMRLGMQHLVRVHRDRRPEFERILADTAERILGEIDRLDTIARAFSRFGAPAPEQAPLEVVDLAATVGEVVNLYRLAAEGAAVELDAAPARVRARRDEVKEVLVNLLENARNAGARSVCVRVAPGALTVEDDGCGIPAELLPRIFEPRFSTNTSGSGLGLAIVRRLVEGWGGEVEVESEVGRGTVARVRLPAA
jgi:signal transduction histidine kinase